MDTYSDYSSEEDTTSGPAEDRHTQSVPTDV